MKASPLQLLLAAAVAVSVLGVALALGGLLAWQDPDTGVVLVVATLAALFAAGVTYLVARGMESSGEAEASAESPSPSPASVAPVLRSPRTVAALPVADLPAPYLAAVMKGLHAARTVSPRAGAAPPPQPGA